MGRKGAWSYVEALSMTANGVAFLLFKYTYFISVVFLRELSSCGSESSEKSTSHDVLMN